jgi:hypothetical protein
MSLSWQTPVPSQAPGLPPPLLVPVLLPPPLLVPVLLPPPLLVPVLLPPPLLVLLLLPPAPVSPPVPLLELVVVLVVVLVLFLQAPRANTAITIAPHAQDFMLMTSKKRVCSFNG